MSTGYTNKVQSGEITDFKDFAIICARAMGACIMQRDDPMDEPPKLDEVSDYYPNALKLAEDNKIKYSKFSDSDWKKEFEDYKKKSIESAENTLKNKEIELNRYESMLEKVYKYTPPTPDHENYKEFMIEQLEFSIKFDCSGDYYNKSLVAAKTLTLNDYRIQTLEFLDRDLVYYKKNDEEEKERVAARNKWIIDLQNSLENL